MYANYRVRKIEGPVLLFGKLFSTNQLCIALNIASIPIMYLFGAGQLMFWVVGKQQFLITVFAAAQSFARKEPVLNSFFALCRRINIHRCSACIILQHWCNRHWGVRIIFGSVRDCLNSPGRLTGYMTLKSAQKRWRQEKTEFQCDKMRRTTSEKNIYITCQWLERKVFRLDSRKAVRQLRRRKM